MSEDATVELQCLPGIGRDGTAFSSNHYRDALWVRWQRGMARKIGGYRAIAEVTGPVRGVHVDSRGGVVLCHTFSESGIEQVGFDQFGVGSSLSDRTPGGFVKNTSYTWQIDSVFQSGGGGTPQLVCSAAPDLLAIDSDVGGPLYAGNITTTAALTQIADGAGNILVSGGCCTLQPFTFVYGSNGMIRNSKENDFSTATGWSGGNSNIANVAGTKIVKGLSLRGGGNSPSGIFWALDALIRVSFVGAPVLWKYDTVSSQTTILGKNTPIEYDGIYYWPGVDRFFVYNGVVQELPNNQNLNWFYDNINFAHRNKMWGTKVTRFGEIWWFFPSGSSTECDQAIIYNVREKMWYDTRFKRAAGASAGVFPYPVFAGGDDSRLSTLLSYSAGIGLFKISDVVTGGTSNASGTVVKLRTGKLNLFPASGTFLNGEIIQNEDMSATGTLSSDPIAQQLDIIWQQEYGADRINGQSILAIPAYFESREFSYATGGAAGVANGGDNKQTRLTRLEPDFILSGDLKLTVSGVPYAQGTKITSEEFTISQGTEYIDLREQRRIMSLRFDSNVVGGTFQMGRNLLLTEPGDVRG